MKRIFGTVGVVLGLAGILGCLAGMGLIWWFSGKYLAPAAETAKAVEALLGSADGRFGKLENGVRDTKQRLAVVRKAAQTVAQDGNKAGPVFRAKVDALVEALLAKVEQAQGVADMLRGGVELVSTMSEEPRTSEDIKAAGALVDKVATALDKARHDLETASREENVEAAAQGVDNLAGALESVLTELARNVTEVSNLLAKGRAEVNSLQRTLLFWKTWGPWIVTGVLVWVALGQIALLMCAWSWMRGEGA
jgi:hypothetical protein